MRTLSLFAAVTGIVLAGSPQPLDAQLRRLEVDKVFFEGNEAFPDDSLARAIVTQETDCRSWVFAFPIPFCALGVEFALRRGQLRDRELPRDQARLMIWYQRRGFRDVQVEAPFVARGPVRAQVTFQIEEGAPVIARTLLFVGAEPFADDGLLEDLPLQAGDRLSTLALDATRDTITSRLNNQGYAYGEVFRRAFRPAADPYNAEVTFEVVPGPLTRYGAINVTGVDDLTRETVLRTMRLTPGELFRGEDVEGAAGRLIALDIIRSASVEAALQPVADSVVDIDVAIQEGDAYRIRTGGGWTTAECLDVEARWTSRNFVGGARVLQVRGRVGNILASSGFQGVLCPDSGEEQYADFTWIASVDLVQPYVFSTDNSLTASLFAERQSLPDIFIRRAVGVQIGVSRVIAPQTVLTGFFRPELSELDADDVLYCTGFLVCEPSDVEVLEGANWLSPVGLTFTRDRSDDLLNPRTGYRLLVDVEHAASWTGSDFHYDRVVAEASRYERLGNRLVLAGRVRGGWVGSGGFDGPLGTGSEVGIVHPQKRFFAGGANSVRGFAQSRLGPRVLVTQPESLMAPNGACLPQEIADQSCDPSSTDERLFDPQPTGGTRVLEANAEIRFGLGRLIEGVLFTDVGQAWAVDDPLDLATLEFSPGVGIRLPSPVGPIRLDVAYNFRGGETLEVVTQQIRPFVDGRDDEAKQLKAGSQTIPWVRSGDLALLPGLLFGQDASRLQIHVSIGQAF